MSNVDSMSLDCVGKPEYLEVTHAGGEGETRRHKEKMQTAHSKPQESTLNT